MRAYQAKAHRRCAPVPPVSAKMRTLSAITLAFALYAGARATPVCAQENVTQILVGYGGISHEGSLNSAYHVNARRHLRTTEAVQLLVLDLPELDLSAEGFFQYGGGGRTFNGCFDPQSSPCVRDASPFWLVGGGLVSRWDVTPEDWPVKFYFLPVTAGVYLRGFDSRRSLESDETPTEIRPGLGIGNGVGIRAQLGDVELLLEARALLVYGGGRGGGLPVSVGIAF